jgi:hypothetical protein
MESTCIQTIHAPGLMSAQIIHVEEHMVGTRAYTLSVFRTDGGLSGEWHCRCGHLAASSSTFATLEDALNDAKQGAQEHHSERHV